MVYSRYQFIRLALMPHATFHIHASSHHTISQPVLSLELIPTLVERGEYSCRDHACLDGRVLCQLQKGKHEVSTCYLSL